MASRRIDGLLAAMVTVALMAAAAPTAAQDTETDSGGDAPDPVMAPAFAWQRTSKLPGLAKSQKSGCPLFFEDALITDAGERIVSGGELFACTGKTSVWRSGDGSEWQREVLEGQRATAIGTDGSTLVVAGTTPANKRDDGVVWAGGIGETLEQVARFKNARLNDLLVTPSGFEVIGTTDLEQGYGFPAVWTSPDGRTWGTPTLLDDKRGGWPVGAVDADGVRLITDANRTDGLLHRSEDGVTWEELAMPEDVRGKRDVSYWPVLATDRGFVLGVNWLGKDRTGSQLWLSPDGREWSPVADVGDRILRVFEGAGGTFALLAPPTDKKGRPKKGKPGTMLWSADDSDWCRMQVDGLSQVSVNAVDSDAEGRLLVTGSVGHVFDGEQVVIDGVPLAGEGVPCVPLGSPAGSSAPVVFGAPVFEPPSTVTACSDASLRAAAGDSMYCASDLIASRKVKAAKALSASPEDFKQSGCVKPAGGTKQDRALTCLFQIASAWRHEQRETQADGLVSQEGFDRIQPMYQWAASSLPKAGKQYLDRGLAKLDRMSLGWERAAPKKPKKVSTVRNTKARNASVASLRKMLQNAWLQSDMAPIPDPLVEMPGGWEEPHLPAGFDGAGRPVDSMWSYLGPRGGTSPTTGLVSKCALAIDPKEIRNVSGTSRTSTCAIAAAKAWLLYLATGDDRFIDVAVGLRDMAIRARSTEGYTSSAKGKERFFFETFFCYLGKGLDTGCPAGL